MQPSKTVLLGAMAALASTAGPMPRFRDSGPKGFCERVKPAKTVKRNDPCPCGSKRKHKHCCGSRHKQAEAPADAQPAE